MIVEGGVVSLIGLAVGYLICCLRRKHKRSGMQEFQETHSDKSQSDQIGNV
jgi:hypothetical protein